MKNNKNEKNKIGKVEEIKRKESCKIKKEISDSYKEGVDYYKEVEKHDG